MRIIRISPLFIIKPYEACIFEFLGKYVGFSGPGLKFMIPLLHTCRVRDVREHTMDIPPQSVITKDNVEIIVDGIVWAKPRNLEADIMRTFYNIDSWKMAAMELATTNLRQEFGNLTLDESLVSRENIANNMQINLDLLTNDWGVHVSKVEIKSIDPPDDIKNAMHKQKIAEQERRSMKLLATGKFEAAEQEKFGALQLAEGQMKSKIMIAEGEAQAIKLVNEAAEMYFKGNAVELRRLQATENSLKNNSKVVITDKGITPQILLGDLPIKKGSS